MEIKITDLDYDSSFNQWVGKSPVKVAGKENPIGYWTLKSWRDMSEKKERKSKENSIRKQFALDKFSDFKRAMEATKKIDEGEDISEVNLDTLPEDVQMEVKKEVPIDGVKKITRRKNYGIPSKFYFENKVHLDKDISEESMESLVQELQQMMVFPTRQRGSVRTKVLPYLGTGSPSTTYKFITKTIDSYLARDTKFLEGFDEKLGLSPDERKKIKERIEDLRKSNPEVIARNNFTLAQNAINWLLIPTALFATIKKWQGLTSFFYDLAKKIAPTLSSTTSGLALVYGSCFLGTVILSSVVFKYVHDKFIKREVLKERSQKREDSNEYRPFDTLAYKVYSGVIIPEDITSHFQKELDFIMYTDSGTPEQRRKSILELWKRFDLNVRSSIEKGIYLRKDEEGSGLTLLDPDLRTNRRANTRKPKVDPFFSRFYDIVKNIEAEDRVGEALTCPDFKDIAKGVMSGKVKIPPQLVKMTAKLLAVEAKKLSRS